MEEELELDAKEAVEKLEGRGWNTYLAISTALIAVVAAIASLASGAYSNQAVLEKNNAVLFQSKASDQWSYYQAKGIKKNVSDAFYQQFSAAGFKAQSDKYAAEQLAIQAQAQSFEKQVEDANKASERSLEKHHKLAFSVTFFQIAIALAALSSLMRRRSFFILSLLFTIGGLGYMAAGFLL